MNIQIKFPLRILLSILLMWSLASCANYKLNYTKESKNWSESQPNTDLDIRHSMYLIGDTGNAKKGETLAIFQYLETELAEILPLFF